MFFAIFTTNYEKTRFKICILKKNLVTLQVNSITINKYQLNK